MFLIGGCDDTYAGRVEYGERDTKGQPGERVARTVSGAAGQLLHSNREATDDEIVASLGAMSMGDAWRACDHMSGLGFFNDVREEIVQVVARHAYRNLQLNAKYVEALASTLLSLNPTDDHVAKLTYEEVVEIFSKMNDGGVPFYRFCNKNDLLNLPSLHWTADRGRVANAEAE